MGNDGVRAIPGQNQNAHKMYETAAQKLKEAEAKANNAPAEQRDTAQQRLLQAKSIFTIAQQRENQT